MVANFRGCKDKEARRAEGKRVVDHLLALGATAFEE